MDRSTLDSISFWLNIISPTLTIILIGYLTLELGIAKKMFSRLRSVLKSVWTAAKKTFFKFGKARFSLHK